MNNVKNDKYYLQKIREDLIFVEKHTENVSREQFEQDEILLNAMMFKLIQISENVKKLSEEYKKANNDIPWQDILGLRNRIVHDYGNVNLEIIFVALKEDIPQLIKQI